MSVPSVPVVPRTALGRSGIRVSRLALGSWRTYERISRDQSLAVMTAAREAGINFLDDARYNDETGDAPLPTGYSEVVFGELFRAAGWRRDDTAVSSKLWWEFWPDESPADRGVAIVASYTLAGGVLTGKYDQDPGAGRAAGLLRQPRYAAGAAAGRQLAALARDVGADPASLAMAFALLNPSVTTVLFGATRPGQVRANLGALALADRLTPDERDRLAAVGT